MTLAIDDFVSNLTAGLASPNKYLVSFNNDAGTVVNKQSVSMMCNVSALPGRGIQTVETRHYNNPFKLPYSASYADITFSFISTINLPERRFFEDWQQLVVDPESGLIGFYNDFKGTVTIEHLEHGTGSVDYSVTLRNAFPIELGEIQLGYSMSNETLISTVTFSYQYWD